MGIFDAMRAQGHEQLLFCHDKTSGLRSIIAIHDTTLGPALGGCRMLNYPSEAEAIADALALSRGMTYKSAASGCDYGGGKAVIWGDPATGKSEALFRSFGRFVQTLGGRFITGTDVGTVAADFVDSLAETEWLVALPESHGGSGDSSLTTAIGVVSGMRACLEEVFGDDTFRGRTVAVQGLGKVGRHLVGYLHEAGAKIYGCDKDAAAVERAVAEYGITPVSADGIFDVECDIFSPNALGQVISAATLPRLRCRIVAGAANNQLAGGECGEGLRARGILYAPDYVINAGGLIQAADELHGFNRDRATRKAMGIYDLLKRIFAIARAEGVTTYKAADMLVEERLATLGALLRIHLP